MYPIREMVGVVRRRPAFSVQHQLGNAQLQFAAQHRILTG
jgi:hypothetical protein